MNNKTFFMLGLLTSCDALWQSQLSTDPTLCTQSSSLCPTGQLCDFSAGTCQPIGGTNPPGWAVSAVPTSSCSDSQTLTITGPVSASLPQVKLNTFTVDPADIKASAGTLTINIPRQLPAGPVQVTLTFSASQPPVLLNPAFQYVTQTPAVTGLTALPITLAQLPATVAQVAAWHPKHNGALDLAVLAGNNNTLVHYRDAAVASRQPASFTALSTLSSLSGGTLLQTGNLATADDALSPGSQDLITATSATGSAAFFVGGADTPVVKSWTPTGQTPASTRQLVAGGYFKDGEGSIQALTFIGWPSGTTTLPIKSSPSPDLKAAATDFFNLQTATINQVPLAVAAGQLNSDANTDVLLLTSDTAKLTNYAYWINGGAVPAAGQFSAIATSVTSVALGNLDKDPLPDAVFGLNPGATLPGQVVVYLNASGQITPAITWDMANPIAIPTKLSPTALAVTDA